jgi:hypothetical protein
MCTDIHLHLCALFDKSTLDWDYAAKIPLEKLFEAIKELIEPLIIHL